MYIGTKMKRILLLLILPTVVFAQRTGSVNGYLHDKATGVPLPYANVMLKDTRFGATSDVHGNYVLNGIPQGNDTQHIGTGYETTPKLHYRQTVCLFD